MWLEAANEADRPRPERVMRTSGSAEGLVDLRVYAASVAVGFMMSSPPDNRVEAVHPRLGHCAICYPERALGRRVSDAEVAVADDMVQRTTGAVILA